MVGAGFERYSDLIPMATEVVTTDITPIGNVKVLADAHFLPFGDNLFDGYVAMEVLEHLPQKQHPQRFSVCLNRAESPF